jgi:hypothetical protein
LKEHIAQFSDSRTVGMRLRKAQNDGVPKLVARRVIPAAVAVVGTRLNHAPGSRWSGKRMARTVGSNKRINPLQHSAGLHDRTPSQQSGGEYRSNLALHSGGFRGELSSSPTATPGLHWAKSADWWALTGSDARIWASI